MATPCWNGATHTFQCKPVTPSLRLFFTASSCMHALHASNRLGPIAFFSKIFPPRLMSSWLSLPNAIRPEKHTGNSYDSAFADRTERGRKDGTRTCLCLYRSLMGGMLGSSEHDGTSRSSFFFVTFPRLSGDLGRPSLLLEREGWLAVVWRSWLGKHQDRSLSSHPFDSPLYACTVTFRP